MSPDAASGATAGTPRPIEPLHAPPDARITLPGSKSITNRALVTAALAAGTSTLSGILVADDTEAMLDGVAALGATVDVDRRARRAEVTGFGGRPRGGDHRLAVRESGTTARFLVPVAALSAGRVTIDAAPAMRRRPMEPLFTALRGLGAEVAETGEAGHLPCVVSGGPVRGGRLAISGEVSSQFLSGLAMAGACLRDGVSLQPTGTLVSRPYLTMTLAVMERFGVTHDRADAAITVPPQRYRATDLAVEPDASAASYFFAAAVVCGGRVRVEGLGPASLQGDARFVDVLEQMGAVVVREPDALEVRAGERLVGVEVDLADLSDTAPTFAVVAAFASTPSRARGIGFIRGKESDRIAAVVQELRRCGVPAAETADGFTVQPAPPTPALVRTYGDHRMAMSFAVLGLAREGIRLADPGCVAKTFPGFFDALEGLRR